MKPSLITRLCNIATKPGPSSTVRLIVTKRICRAFVLQIDSIRAERRAMNREATKLKAFLPFTRQAILDLYEQARGHREDELSGAQRVLEGFGQSLIFDREELASDLGFGPMCDILSVNPVHRQQVHPGGLTSLYEVVYISQLEDSTTRYGERWGDGSPLYRACHAAVIQFVRTCPEGELPNLFGPKPPPDLSIVRT